MTSEPTIIGQVIVYAAGPSGPAVDGVGEPHEMSATDVNSTVEDILAAEGQGVFVLELAGQRGWAIYPTRSIHHVEVHVVDTSDGPF